MKKNPHCRIRAFTIPEGFVRCPRIAKHFITATGWEKHLFEMVGHDPVKKLARFELVSVSIV